MDNAQKAIMIGVGLFITIIIISSVLLISNLGRDMISTSQTKLGEVTTDLNRSMYADYDGKVISGTELLAAVRKYATSTDISVAIYSSKEELANNNAAATVGKGILDLSASTKYAAEGIRNASVDTTKGTSGYTTAAQNITTTAYYETALVYDSQQKIIGFVAVLQSNAGTTQQ